MFLMKKAFFLLSAILLLTGNSCSKKDKEDELTQDILFQMVVSAKWEIVLYAEDDDVLTSGFADYTFSFLSSNDIRATDGTNIHFGDWYVYENPSTVEGASDFIFHITFTEPENFVSLTGDWDVLSADAQSLQMQIARGEDGSIGRLIFNQI